MIFFRQQKHEFTISTFTAAIPIPVIEYPCIFLNIEWFLSLAKLDKYLVLMLGMDAGLNGRYY